MAQASLFRFKLLFFVQFTAYGLLSPYVPIFFEDLGMEKWHIGVLTMLPNMCTFMVAPLFGFIGITAFDALVLVIIMVHFLSLLFYLQVTSFEHTRKS